MRNMIYPAFVWFRNSLRDPSWIAAYALLIQVFLFWWQARILRRHAATMEKQTEISQKQADTAELIGQALKQQGTILADQTKIMEDQLKFQREIAAHTERKLLWDLVLDLQSVARFLVSTMQHAPHTNEALDSIAKAWIDLGLKVAACWQALVPCAHLELNERTLVIEYLEDVQKVEKTKQLAQLTAMNEKYKGLLGEILKNVRPISTVTSGT